MAKSSHGSDFDIYKSLWSNINDVCAPPPPPGHPAKACFLMEMPGFSVNPNAFDPTKFDPGTMTSPECATAMLCDRIPALAQYFYDTGDHISFNWQVLLNTYGISATAASENAGLKERYDDAIKMLYGSQEGYIKQEKTQLFKNMEVLREIWHESEKKKVEYKTKCQSDKENWPGNYQTGVAPYKEAIEQAYIEYNNLKSQIKQYEAAIFAFATGDLNTIMLDQQSKLAQHRMDDAGNTDTTFYQTNMQPANWYKWFVPESEKSSDSEKSPESEKDDEGWTEVIIEQVHSHESSHDTYSQVSAEASASFGGLFYSGSVGGGFSKKDGNSSLTKEGSDLKISFKVRKVIIQRPWLEPSILQYSTLGIEGMDKGTWSNGKLDKSNEGSFPLLPTACIVAKDVVIQANSFSDTIEKQFSENSEHASTKVGIGCFTVGGNFSHASGSDSTKHEYNGTSKTLKIHGAQIIGWVCTAIHEFPVAEVK